MRRKGQQLLGQIIIFVIGLAVIGAVLLFGYSTVKNFQEQKCDVQRVQFGTQLSSFLERNKGWGTNKVVRLDTPCDTTHVCVVDRQFIDNNVGTDISDQAFVGTNPSLLPVPNNARSVIRSSIRANVPANVFTINAKQQVLPVEKYVDSSAPVSFNSLDSLNKRIACFAIAGDIFSVQMVGDGRLVELQEVDE